MIEHGQAIKTYSTLMLRDYATARGDDGWAPLDNKLRELSEHLPVLIHAYEHYEKSSEEFLKFGEPIPRIKAIVEFYGQLIVLLRDNFTHEASILLSAIVEGPAIALTKADSSGEALKALNELETMFFDSLATGVVSEKIDEKLEQLTAAFLAVPSPSRDETNFRISDEILDQTIAMRRKALEAWFELLDDYWLAKAMK